MPKIPAINPLLQAWLLEGPLSAQVPAYVERLRRGRYATHTSGRCLNGMAHFAHWMSMCHLPVHMLDEGCIDQFLRYHLPRCDCLGGALRTPMELHAALVPVLEILRAEGVVTKIQQRVSGPHRGGIPFARGSLFHLLKNPVYRGKIVHKGKVYDGEHEAIVDEHLVPLLGRLDGNQGRAHLIRSQRISAVEIRSVHSGVF